jgi:hypothetical protein
MLHMRSGSTRQFAAALFIASICMWIATPHADAEPSEMIACHIKTTTRDGVLQLDAIAGSRKPSRGRYRLDIVKNSASGSNQSTQSGDFVLEPDRSSILTTVVLDGSAIGHYRATLLIDSSFGSVTCVSP